MLACHCKMIKPFTFATTKKSSVLRHSSFIKLPLGCSCYDMKKIVILHVVGSRYFTKRVWETQNKFFKEQKNFIWTSIKFWKVPDDNNTPIKSPKISVKEFPREETSQVMHGDKIELSQETNKVFDKPACEDGDCRAKKGTTESDKNIVVTETNYLNNEHSNQEKNKKLSMESKKDSGQEKIDKYVTENIILTVNKKKNSDLKVAVPGIDTRIILKPPKKEPLLITDPNDNSKSGGKSGSNEEIKRQMYELNLGELSMDKKLAEQLDNLSSEAGTERPTAEVQLLKENPQKFFEKAKNILLKATATIKPDENERIGKVVSLGEPKGNISASSTTRRRQTVDLNRTSTERNFITPVRAMTDFLLKPSDLEGLRKTKRRSPYENDPPITVYWRKDVEAKAIDVWGSKENLLKEILKRDIERRRYQQNLFTVKRRLRDYRREQGRESEFKLEQNGLWGSSGKVVMTAVVINGANFMFKLIAWLYTGSHSMFSETIHSLADTINQLILAYGIHKSVQRADSDHPYGYTNMRYVASLISGVGIFCVGSGLSFYHGVVGLTDPSELESFFWAYFILGGSLCSEGATLLVAFNSIRSGAKKSEMSLSEYVYRGQDPSVNVVLLEDAAAVIGVGLAGVCMGLSSHYGSHIPDAIGSFLVGGLLATVASFIIYTNVAALVGRSIPQERLDKINTVLESDVMIRAIHDVKGIDIGNSLVRYKAEMDFDGGELTRSYLDKQDLNQMLEEVRKMQTIDELEEFMLKHGENIVDMMGGEIDRIELKLRKKHPEIRHCDLEIL